MARVRMKPEPQQTQYSPALNISAAVFFMIWAGVGWIAYLGNAPLRASLFRGPDPGPALLPLITLSILTLGGAIILIRGLIGLWRHTTWAEGLPDPRSHARPMLFMLSLIVAVALMSRVGFLAVGFVLSGVWLFALSSASQPLLRRTVIAVVLAAAITFAIWFGFVEVLRISLPR